MRLDSLGEKTSRYPTSKERDNQLKQRYMTTIFDDMDKGYIAAVTNQDAKNIWYLPHHPVINKQKPDKIRRVMDNKPQATTFEKVIDSARIAHSSTSQYGTYANKSEQSLGFMNI